VDGVYVGPADLSLALGCKPRLDQTDPPVVDAQQKIVAACKRHGVVAGIHNATSGYALKMMDAGYQFLTLATRTCWNSPSFEPRLRRRNPLWGRNRRGPSRPPPKT
jgi:2-keto-3-deoxy-L-rhamnonate aldolase RhmA